MTAMWRCLCLFSLLLLAEAQNGNNGKVLTPQYFNLAEDRRILATSTCGDASERELYCKITGVGPDAELLHEAQLIQGQECYFCEEGDHAAEKAIDGTPAWWQSPPLSRG